MLGLDPKLQHDFIVTPLRPLQQLLAAWARHGRRAVREPAVRDTGLEGTGLPQTWLAAALLGVTPDGLSAPLERVLVLPGTILPAEEAPALPALERGRALLERGALAEAVAVLEQAWRSTRSPTLAQAICALDVKLPDTPLEVPKKKAELEERWLARVGAARPATLFAAPWPTQWRDAQRRMNALYALPRSPRLARAALTLGLREPRPYTAQAAQAFWQGLAWFIAEQGDLGALEGLAQLEAALARFVRRTETPATDALRAVVPRPLTPAEQPLVEALATQAGEAPQVRAPVARPAPKPEARRVWADELLEAGDPRGELATLQLALAEGSAGESATARLKTLFNKHLKTWAPAGLARDTVVFRGGVPVEGQLVCRSDRELEAFIGAPWLASLERLVVDRASALGRVRAQTEARFVAQAGLGALRCAAVFAETANELCDCPPSRLVHLQLVDDGAIELDGEGLVGLERLDVQRPRLTAWPRRPWFQRLRALGLSSVDALADLRDEPGLPPTLVAWSWDEHHLRQQAGARRTWELLLHRASGLSVELRPLPGARVASGLALLDALRPFSGVHTVSVPAALAGPRLDTWAKERGAAVALTTPALGATGTSLALLRSA